MNHALMSGSSTMICGDCLETAIVAAVTRNVEMFSVNFNEPWRWILSRFRLFPVEGVLRWDCNFECCHNSHDGCDAYKVQGYATHSKECTLYIITMILSGWQRSKMSQRNSFGPQHLILL